MSISINYYGYNRGRIGIYTDREREQMSIQITDAEALLILAMMRKVTIERDKPLAENIKQIIYQAKLESDNDT